MPIIYLTKRGYTQITILNNTEAEDISIWKVDVVYINVDYSLKSRYLFYTCHMLNLKNIWFFMFWVKSIGILSLFLMLVDQGCENQNSM